VIDRDPLESDEYRADHLHRDLHDFSPVHSVEMMNHHAPVNPHDCVLSLVLMVVMMACRKMDGHLMDDLSC
jgi:hypothetical protein